MTHCLKVAVCLIAILVNASLFAQSTLTQTSADTQDTVSSEPVAYVYVSSYNSTFTATHVAAFAAASDGELKPLPGSPFPTDVTKMAVTGKFLFGTDANGKDIDSFSIASDGTLRQVAHINVQTYNAGGCSVESPGQIFLDHTGATLYESVFRGNDCDYVRYLSFRVEKSSGELQYVGSSGETFIFYPPLSFIGNNVYAYGAACFDPYGQSLSKAGAFLGFQRHNDGLLTIANRPALPASNDGSRFYCPSLTAADRTDHVAVSLQAAAEQGPVQLAAYTADEYGNLKTTSTAENMPVVDIGTLNDLKMSPSGKLLAVAGMSGYELPGLEVFHFNGADPITAYTGLLPTFGIQQMFWDNDNHLYALSTYPGKLYVFTVTQTGFIEAPGSPYAIPDNPGYIIVLPKTPQPKI